MKTNAEEKLEQFKKAIKSAELDLVEFTSPLQKRK